MKKIFYCLGAVATITAPITAVVSCGSNSKNAFSVNEMGAFSYSGKAVIDVSNDGQGHETNYFSVDSLNNVNMHFQSDHKINYVFTFSLYKNFDKSDSAFYEITPLKCHIEDIDLILSDIESKLSRSNRVSRYSDESHPEIFTYDKTDEGRHTFLTDEIFQAISTYDLANWIQNNVTHGTEVKWTKADNASWFNVIGNEVTEYIKRNPTVQS